MIKKIKVNPRLTAKKLTSELYKETRKKVHPDTIRRALKESGYNGKRGARKKSFINEANRKKKFAKEFIFLRNSRITSTRSKELKLRLKEEWTCIIPGYLTKIISNIPKHLQHVIKQKGYPTKY